MTEDEMVGWHHQLNGHKFEQTLGHGEGQGSLVCCSPWGLKEAARTEQPDNNSNNYKKRCGEPADTCFLGHVCELKLGQLPKNGNKATDIYVCFTSFYPPKWPDQFTCPPAASRSAWCFPEGSWGHLDLSSQQAGSQMC